MKMLRASSANWKMSMLFTPSISSGFWSPNDATGASGYLNKETELQTKDYRINIGWISRITLSPWLPSALQEAIKRTLRSIEGCEHLRISPSTAVNSERWKSLVIDALDRGGGKDSRNK